MLTTYFIKKPRNLLKPMHALSAHVKSGLVAPKAFTSKLFGFQPSFIPQPAAVSDMVWFSKEDGDKPSGFEKFFKKKGQSDSKPEKEEKESKKAA